MSRRALAVLALLLSALLILPVQAALAQEGDGEQQGGPEVATVQIKVVDIEGRPLGGATVEAYNATGEGQKVLNSTTTNATGWAVLTLPINMTYDFKVFWMNALVGALENVTVMENMTLGPINCTVCDLIIRVVDAGGLGPLFGISLSINITYTNRDGEPASLLQEVETNTTGLCALTDVLMNATYEITASRDKIRFNTTTVGPLNGTTVVNITCPRYTIQVSLVDEDMRPITGPGVRVEAYDWDTGRLLASSPVDERGLARLEVLVGLCSLKAFRGDELIGEITRAVDENDTWVLLICSIENLSLRVLVLDALGNPVPGLEVRLLKGDEVVAVAQTDENGLAVFHGLSSGLFKVVVVSGNQTLAMTSVELRRDQSVELRLGDKLRLLGALVDLAALVMSLSVGLAVLFMALAVFLWPRLSGRKTL